ncbi:unnamed protein product [Spodoptera littoralis]|uniref:Uncharacterized protein n=1 Tax=Spodoptera littoralis TaxID=7109 RepID=A0A9P0IG49_SPOLI|nr:unnamed protein product [Spodoptera littoralis]CAH1645237.1 unnamed protein product [Spodoptera littoralis]
MNTYRHDNTHTHTHWRIKLITFRNNIQRALCRKKYEVIFLHTRYKVCRCVAVNGIYTIYSLLLSVKYYTVFTSWYHSFKQTSCIFLSSSHFPQISFGVGSESKYTRFD